ncbi:MAG: hypothetical protein O2887_08535 [Bacteroidetes bacterium]|nr:hypothetical protein [Bacteroidota bacterium]MDA1120525.1 hypothetical protein [Bacteroidota bacterium]
MKLTLFISALIILATIGSSCGEDTGTCTTTCISKSTGTNLGSVSYENYTRKECQEALENRQTILTDCSMEWN